MKIPHRNSTRIILIVFAVLTACATGLAYIELRSVIPLFVFVFCIFALWKIGQVSVHIEIRSGEMACYQAFTIKVVPLSELEKIVVDSSDHGTVTLHFARSKVRLMQSRKTTRLLIGQIMAEKGDVEFIDAEGWYVSAKKKG